MATYSNIFAWEIPWTEEPGRLYIVHRVTKSQMWLSTYATNLIMQKRDQGEKTMMMTLGSTVRKYSLEEVEFYLLLLSWFTDTFSHSINIHWWLLSHILSKTEDTKKNKADMAPWLKSLCSNYRNKDKDKKKKKLQIIKETSRRLILHRMVRNRFFEEMIGWNLMKWTCRQCWEQGS